MSSRALHTRPDTQCLTVRDLRGVLRANPEVGGADRGVKRADYVLGGLDKAAA
eukprot:CAMPEP_0115267062 /NCGR_PEP_ID=MMETSP0270-20121206/51795_1 /TAXON_ID=71861 /ORGANISM="Scrippsiella trochoidea, Strain CCMP3099" /LENGTH=52 /DNA_ID=CAMNT_0002683189 /DNA_START=310 /DNA_END=469 /DNA_ORIENTATION=-